jgi:hypothetical protein
MRIPANILSRRWLDFALSGNDTVGFTWLVVTAFVRISTKIGLFPSPLSTDEALDQVRSWLDAPGARTLEPTGQHLSVLARLLSRRSVAAATSSTTRTWRRSPSSTGRTSSPSMPSSAGSPRSAGGDPRPADGMRSLPAKLNDR